MNTLTIRLTKPHEAQREILRAAKRFNVLACGRRFGKDTLAMNLYAETGIDGYPAAWFTPSYKMLTETFQEVARILKPIATRVNGSEHRIELVTDGILDMWSLENEDAARGRKYKRVIVNEAGLVPQLTDAFNYVIRPTLADYEGDAWFLGTPKGRNGFYQYFTRSMDDAANDWAAWQKTTYDNPFIKPSEIDAMKIELPERVYQQEILAQFLEDAGGVFRNVRACATLQPSTPEQHAGHVTVMGGDWGQQNDFTTYGVFCQTCRKECETDRFNQIAWSIQRARLKAMAERWQPQKILLELNSIGSPNVEALQEEGLPVIGFETTASSKPQLIQSLVLALERKEIQLLNDPITIAELESYEEKRSAATGRPTYSAPEGMHDDTVMRVALEWYAATAGIMTGQLFY